MNEKRWRIAPQDLALVSQLEAAANVPSVVAQLLVARGVSDPKAVTEFLDVKLSNLRDPEELPGLTAAADKIYAAAKEGKRIVVYGDYDADGMTSTAILFGCLKLLSADVTYFVPNRMEEGYGLNSKAIERLASHGAKMIVSVDCGISSIDEAETAKRVGVDLIITDHHEPAATLPDAAGIVHPRLPGHTYPFAGLCGAGVALKIAWGLCQRQSSAKRVTPALRDFLMRAVGLAAIGTICDVVPLVDENRAIVKHGLRSLPSYAGIGLQQLMKLTKLDSKEALKSEDIGFVVGPRLNAAGRLGQAQLGVELLTTESEDRAKSLAEYINELNSSRTSLERSVYLSAAKQIKESFDPDGDPALIVAGRGWHQGVIGIVAGRLAEKYHRPTVVISLDELGGKAGVGSARSVRGVNLFHALNACEEHLETHGGHAAAAGLRIDEAHVDQFRSHFCDHIAETFGVDKMVAELDIDSEVIFSQMTIRTVRQIESLMPFGESNPRPLFCATGARIDGKVRPLGQGERHVSVNLMHHGVKLRAIAFNQPDWLVSLPEAADQSIDIAFRPSINEFRGMRTVQIQLVDWKPTAK